MARYIEGADAIKAFLQANPDASYQVMGGANSFLSDPFLLQSLQDQERRYQQMLAAQQGPGGVAGFLNNLGKSIVDPFARGAKVLTTGLTGLTQGEQAMQDMQKGYFGEDANLAEEALKSAAGIGAWFVPGMGPTGSVLNLATRGALAGGLGSLSTQNFLTDQLDVGNVLQGALLGGAIGGGIGLGSKALNKLAGKTTQQLDDVIARQQEAIMKAGGQGDDIARQLGSTGQLGDLNSKLNFLSGADDITKGVPSTLAGGQGFAVTPAERLRLAQDLMKHLPKDAPEISKMVLQDIINKGGGAAQTGITNTQIANALKASKVTGQSADDFLRALGSAEKLAYSADDLVAAGQTAGLSDDVLAKLTNKAGVPSAAGTGGVGDWLVKQADYQELNALTRELGRPMKSLGSVGTFKDAKAIMTPGGEPLLRLGDSADEVLRKTNEVLAAKSPIVDDAVSKLSQQGVTVDSTPVREQLQKMIGSKLTSAQKQPLAKALSMLDEVAPPGGQVNYADVYKVLQGTQGVGTKADALVMAMQQRTPGAVGATVDDVAFMLKDMGMSDDIARNISSQLGTAGNQVPIDKWHQFIREVGPLTKSSTFAPVKEQTAASAYNKLFGKSKDIFDQTLKTHGFTQLKPLNDQVHTAIQLKQHLIGRLESGVPNKALGLNEVIGAGGGVLLSGGNPLGAIPGMAMSKFIRGDAANRMYIEGLRKLGGALGGAAPATNVATQAASSAAPNLLSKVAGLPQGVLRSPAIQKLLSDQGTKILTSIAAPTAARSLEPTGLTLNADPGSVLGIQKVQAAELPQGGAVEGEIVGGAPSATQVQGGGDFAGGGATSLFSPEAMAELQGGGAGAGTGFKPGTTVLDILDASLQATGGDIRTAMALTEFLMSSMGLSAGSGGEINKDVAGLQLAEGLVNEAEELSGALGLGDVSVLQKATSPLRDLASKVGLDPSYDQYRQQKMGLVARIARAMGETGPLTDVDIARYALMLPDAGDTQAQADEKIRRLRDRLQRAQQVYQGGGLYGGSSGGDDEMIYDESMLSSAFY